MKMKILILGSTGSIGKSTLEIISKDKKNFDVILLSANNNYKKLVKQAKELSKNLWWGCEFNVSQMTAVLACQYTDGTIHYFNEVVLKNSNT